MQNLPKRRCSAIIHNQLPPNIKTLPHQPIPFFPGGIHTCHKFPTVSSKPGAKLEFTYKNYQSTTRSEWRRMHTWPLAAAERRARGTRDSVDLSLSCLLK